MKFKKKKLKYSVQAVILNKHNQILAVSRKNNHEDFGLVGGKVDKTDKSLKSALIREIKEETGLKVKKKHLHKIFQIHKGGKMSITYYCTKYSGLIYTNEPHVVKWGSIEDIIKGTFGKYNKLVQECLIDMGIKVSSKKELLCEMIKESQELGMYDDINAIEGKILCKVKGCPSEAMEYSKYCNSCYDEKYPSFFTD